MDRILEELQGKAFHLSQHAYDFLSRRYEDLTARPIPPLRLPGTDPESPLRLIELHRRQFHTREYIRSRIDDPSTGTIDHIHAEITSVNAVRLGSLAGLEGYGLELLRMGGHLHDSDRSFPRTMIRGEQEVRHDPAAYRQHKELHVRSSADRAKELADQVRAGGYGLPEGLVEELRYLIIRHEKGGEKNGGRNRTRPSVLDLSLNLNDLADIIRDADSLAYFDANILTNWEECGRDRRALGNKIHFMFDRMAPGTREELRQTILYSENHILGRDIPEERDLMQIRRLLLEICGNREQTAG